jgi:hypothetical protein
MTCTMTDFLSNIVQRSSGSNPTVRSRTPSMFEPISIREPIANPGLQESAEIKSPTIASPVKEMPSGVTTTPVTVESTDPNPLPQSIFQIGSLTDPPTPIFETQIIDDKSRWEVLDARLGKLSAALLTKETVGASPTITVDKSSFPPMPTIARQSEFSGQSEAALAPKNSSVPISTVQNGVNTLTTIVEQIHLHDRVTLQSPPVIEAKHLAPERQLKKDPTPEATAVPTVSVQSNEQHEPSMLNRPIPPVAAPVSKRDQSPAHTVTVSIGRLEIRAQESRTSTTPPANSAGKQSRVMSLDQYISMRSRGEIS